MNFGSILRRLVSGVGRNRARTTRRGANPKARAAKGVARSVSRKL